MPRTESEGGATVSSPPRVRVGGGGIRGEGRSRRKRKGERLEKRNKGEEGGGEEERGRVKGKNMKRRIQRESASVGLARGILCPSRVGDGDRDGESGR